MKKLALFCLFVGVFATTFSQQKMFSLGKGDYLQKSKRQKKTAKILLGSGGILLFTGVIMAIDDLGRLFSNEPSTNPTTQGILVISGYTAILASIPFYIASSKNKKKAAALTFKNQRMPLLLNTNLIYKAIPSVSIRISL